jgi:hypothetical protein
MGTRSNFQSFSIFNTELDGFLLPLFQVKTSLGALHTFYSRAVN